MERQPFLRS